jgi:pimeloyl-ACP methyl ester carboxylesterase
MGSRLIDPASDRIVWGAFGGNSVSPHRAADTQLIAHPMALGAPLHTLTNDVISDRALDRIDLRLLGIPLEAVAYRNILLALGAGGYRDEDLGDLGVIDYGTDHYTCFQFHYDWRRSNMENAQRLGAFIREKGEDVRREHEHRFGPMDGPVKFDIVAHSMGGLLARYYLRYGEADLPEDGSPPEITWAGAKQVSQLILVGTPNGGSLFALDRLVNGLEIFTQAFYPPTLVSTMPALYELLPRPRHHALYTTDAPDETIDLYDPDVWERFGWGIAHPKADDWLSILLPEVADPAERRAIARDHLEKILSQTQRFHEALDLPASPPPGVTISLFAGDAVATPARMQVNPKNGALRVVHREPGDGTVTRRKALLDERNEATWSPRMKSPIAWNHVMFLFSSHLGLTQDPAFTDNLLYQLLEHPQ